MKKFFNSVLAAALALTLVAGPAFAKGEAEFTDVAGIDEEAAILKLHALGAIQGYVDGDYHPEDELTRAQFALILARALGQEKLAESLAGQNIFPDTASGYDWAKGAINLAASKGWITGYPNGNFGPADTLTDEQMITILVRAVGAKVEASEPWYVGYMLKAADLEITYDAIGVGEGATRAKAAQSVLNMLEVPVLAGEYNAKDGVARLTTEKHKITNVDGKKVTVEVKAADDKNEAEYKTYNLADVPVYGTPAKSATLEVIYIGKDIKMARVASTVKTLAYVEKIANGTYIVVKEDGEEKAYPVTKNADLPLAFSKGVFYNFSFNADGQIIAATANDKVTGNTITGKVQDADGYKIIIGDSRYLITSAAAVSYESKIDGQNFGPSATGTANVWKLVKSGDQLSIPADGWNDKGQIVKATIKAGTIDAEIVSAKDNKVTIKNGTHQYVLDLRAYRNVDFQIDGEDVVYTEFVKGDKVVVSVDPEKATVTAIKAKAENPLIGKFVEAVSRETKDGTVYVTSLKIEDKWYEVTAAVTIGDADGEAHKWAIVDEITITDGKISHLALVGAKAANLDGQDPAERTPATVEDAGSRYATASLQVKTGATIFKKDFASNAVIVVDGDEVSIRALDRELTAANVDFNDEPYELVYFTNKAGDVIRVEYKSFEKKVEEPKEAVTYNDVSIKFNLIGGVEYVTFKHGGKTVLIELEATTAYKIGGANSNLTEVKAWLADHEDAKADVKTDEDGLLKEINIVL